jgi:hypothetical protein
MKANRKPRRTGHVCLAPIELAKAGAGRLTPAEIVEPIACLRTAARALREGVATEWEWMVVASALNVAQAIERQGVVHGLSGHLHAAEMALKAIHQRAMAGGEWFSTPLDYQEIEDITSMVDLHEFQLSQVSYGEFRRAVDLVTAFAISSTNIQRVAA